MESQPPVDHDEYRRWTDEAKQAIGFTPEEFRSEMEKGNPMVLGP